MTPPDTTQPTDDPRSAFVRASVWHGALDEAARILEAHPGLAGADIHVAALLGDAAAVRRFLEEDPARATAAAPPLGWDPLTHLCFSRWLRLAPERSGSFIGAARALLDAGASANTGFFDPQHQPTPAWESVLYGAAGVAHHVGLTRLLLEHGADPADGEVVYHAPEGYDHELLRLLLDTGRLDADALALMLLRKIDWHDHDGVTLLLDRGADPNRMWAPGRAALHHALLRDNWIETIALLLDHGADPVRREAGHTAVERAAWRGRGDVLALLEARGVDMTLDDVHRLVAACARGDAAAARAAAAPAPVQHVVSHGAELLACFALTDNAAGVAQLLDLGVPVDARWAGDGYWGVRAGSTALHVAAWLLRPDVVRVLLERGADVDAHDANGRTPLVLAVRASVESYWRERRSVGLIETLLAAGAAASEVKLPTGDAEIDEVLRGHRR